MQQNRTIITVITAWLLMLMPMGGRSQETGDRSQETGVESQGFELRKEHDSLYWLRATGGSQDQATGGSQDRAATRGEAGRRADEWRLPYPVYQFQTGDVDGDGSEDAMVGVIKKTRFYPLGKRLFIFKQIDAKAGVRRQEGRIRPPLTPPTQEGKLPQEPSHATASMHRRKLVRPMWLGSKLGSNLEDFRYVAPADGDSLGRIRALESTTDSLFAVSDYKWSGFGMKFDHLIIKGVDKETALKHFEH